MHSIGDILDKLIIENIKLYNLREEMNVTEQLTPEQRVNLNSKITVLNDNRGVLVEELDKKISRVMSGEEKNQLLKKFKTYTQGKK